MPDRLAYREWLPAACRYASFVGDEEAEATALAALLRQYLAGDRHTTVPSVAQLAWPAQLDHYRRAIDNAIRTAAGETSSPATSSDSGDQA